jgi:hypothetical protein
VRAEGERQQQLRGRQPEAHRGDDHHRQQRCDGAVDADQRGQQRDEQEHRDE